MRMACWAKTLLLCIVGLGISACAPKGASKPSAPEMNVGQVALLPIAYPSGVTRERAEYIRQAVYNDLKGSGFLVLDSQVVDRICSDAPCAGRSKLASEYKVESFLELNISSAARNNFVAGYYNTIQGQAKLKDRQGKELASLDETESERGGLLFNSGQLLQGLISTSKNTQKDSFNFLAERFARKLVDRLPSQKRVQLDPSALALNLNKVEVQALRPPIYHVCADATPNALMYYVSGKLRSNMREVQKGRYCSNYSLEPYFYSDVKPAVELRSPFGNSLRQELNLSAIPRGCRLDGLVAFSRMGNSNRLMLQCEAGAPQCESKLMDCRSSRFLVYRGEPPTGPFTRLAEFKGNSWIDAKTPSAAVAYEVVAVNNLGMRSRPVSVSMQSKD